MSRIGNKPIELPQGVELKMNGAHITVKGPKATLERDLPAQVTVKVDGGTVVVERVSEDRKAKAMHGLGRTLVQNMVLGVSEPFKKTLEISGVGYRAELKGSTLNLQVGLSHDVNFEIPKEVSCKIDKQTTVHLESANKEMVGQLAAKIRGVRPCEPYKGKGIKYADERIRRKEGKTGAK
ncbi:MAG: 50S ribosomal protein L6 [Myxococcota bacterium]